ncbi:MAG: extracellular solute-binding protein [Verrucomicrobiota bacterium]
MQHTPLSNQLPGLCALFLGVFLLPYQTSAKDELIIVSPHWEGIQYEFGIAFEKYYQERNGKEVQIRWRDLGGTSQIEKAIDAGYHATPESCQIDIFFGGGIDPFESQKAKGQLHPYRLPASILNQIPTSIGGFPIVDSEFTFYGAALSSFGVLENCRVIEYIDLPSVETWEDLTRPELLSWVSSADPRKSGSVHMIYEIILQAYGWEKGWSIIYQMSGNVRSFLQNSSAPTKEVAAGDAAYAVSIDINGMTQQAFLGKTNVQFQIPKGVSVINPDGIAILKGAPHLDVAKQFVEFVMSEEGQSLWMSATGKPGGAEKFGITRMGILPAMYEKDLQDLLVPLNPFQIDYPFQYNSQLGSHRWRVINDLMGQTIIDVHHTLKESWKALIQMPNSQEKSALMKKFSQPPITESQAAEYASFWGKDTIRARTIANQWMDDANSKFESIRSQASNPQLASHP